MKKQLGIAIEGLVFLLLLAALLLMQTLIAGARMVFSLPSYALLGVAALLVVFIIRKAKPVPNRLCLIVTALFFAYILGRALLSPVPYIARSDIASVLGGLAVYFLTACFLTGSRQRLALLALLLGFALVHVGVGIIQYRDGTNFMPIAWLQRYDYDRRASGLYGCPNHLAGLLEVLAVMGLSVVCWSRWPVWGKLLVAYGAASCFLGLILTGSRGGYLSTVAGLAAFGFLSLLVLRKGGAGLAWKAGGLGALAALILGLAVTFYLSKSDYLKVRAQTTFDVSNIRLDLWQGAIAQWKLQPIAGTGAGTYIYYGRLFRTERVQRDPIYVHNDYFHLLAEYGLVGVLGMGIFLVVHLRHGLRSFARLGPKRVAASGHLLSNALALNIGASAAVASLLVHSIFDFNLHIPANVLLLALVFGILANDGVERGPLAPGVPRAQLLWRFLLPAFGLALLVQTARLLPGEYYAELARTAVRDGRSGLALHYATKGLARDPANPDLHLHRAGAFLQYVEGAETPEAKASYLDAAIESLRRAHDIAPLEQSYALELATSLDQAKRFDEAESLFREIVRLDPKSDSVRRAYEGHRKLLQSEAGGAGPEPGAMFQ